MIAPGFQNKNVGASIARPAVECIVFAENRCEIVHGTARTANGRPYRYKLSQIGNEIHQRIEIAVGVLVDVRTVSVDEAVRQ